MAKRTPKSIKANCDKLFSKLIRMKGKCERCGFNDYSRLQCAHIYSRTYGSVRFEEDNAICLCSKCHFWGHQNPIEFTAFVKSLNRNLNKLQKKRNEIVKRKLKDWLELERELKVKLNFK